MTDPVPLAEKDEAMSLEQRVRDLLYGMENGECGPILTAKQAVNTVRSEIARDLEADPLLGTRHALRDRAVAIARGASS